MAIDLPSEEICNEYAAETCFARAKPLRLKKIKKEKPDFEILTDIFDLQKKQVRQKKPEFQNLASKMPNWQPCTRPATA